MKTFHTFETFHPKRVEDRAADLVKKLTASIDKVHVQLDTLTEAAKQIQSFRDMAESIYEICIKSTDKEKVQHLPLLKKTLEIAHSLGIERLGGLRSTTELESLTKKVEELAKKRTFSFLLPTSIAAKRPRQHVYRLAENVLFIVEEFKENSGPGTAHFHENAYTAMKKFNAQWAVNGQEHIVFWFDATPEQIKNMVEEVKKMFNVVETSADHFTISS